MSFPQVRIRPMSAADLERVVEIAAGLPEAPQWAASVYRAALDPSNAPRRIALVAEWGLQADQDSSALKAHGGVPSGSRAARGPNKDTALAAEGMQVDEDALPQGLKPGANHPAPLGAVKTAPFRDGGLVVGFAVASVVAPEAELETIAVAPKGQRRGVGAWLLRSLVDELRPEQVTELLLEVRASNRTALAFYRALGFRDAGRRARYYADPEEDAVLMALRLP